MIDETLNSYCLSVASLGILEFFVTFCFKTKSKDENKSKKLMNSPKIANSKEKFGMTHVYFTQKLFIIMIFFLINQGRFSNDIFKLPIEI